MEIEARRAALALPKKQIARLCGLDQNTVGRVLRSGRGLSSTVEKIKGVLDAEERHRLMRLIERQRHWLLEQFPDGISFKSRGLPGQKELVL